MAPYDTTRKIRYDNIRYIPYDTIRYHTTQDIRCKIYDTRHRTQDKGTTNMRHHRPKSPSSRPRPLSSEGRRAGTTHDVGVYEWRAERVHALCNVEQILAELWTGAPAALGDHDCVVLSLEMLRQQGCQELSSLHAVERLRQLSQQASRETTG